MTIGGTFRRTPARNLDDFPTIWGSHPPVTTRANTSTSTFAAPRPQQRARGGVGGCARGQHVIDQQHLASAHRRAFGDAKCPLDVLARWARLRPTWLARRLDALERGGIARLARLPRHLPRERRRLVEPPPPQLQQDAAARGREGRPRRSGRPRRAPSSGAIGAASSPRSEYLSRCASSAGGPILEPGDGARAPIDRRIGHRLRRQQPLAEILLERGAEPLAERPLDEAHGAPAARA